MFLSTIGQLKIWPISFYSMDVELLDYILKANQSITATVNLEKGKYAV